MSSKRGERTPGPADEEADDEDRAPSEAIHRAPRNGAGDCGRDEKDCRAEAKEALDAGHEDEGQRRYGGNELDDGRVDGERCCEQKRIAPNDAV